MAVVLNASGEYLSYSGTQLDARNDYTWMTWVRADETGLNLQQVVTQYDFAGEVFKPRQPTTADKPT